MALRISPVKTILAGLCSTTMAAAWATEFGTVVSSTPVVASVPVVQQQCFDEPVAYQRQSSGAGALIGAIAGAAIGNGVGAGAGRAVATGIGMVTGAAIGDQVEANGSPRVTAMAPRCRNVTRYENRTVGYDVVYDYQGVRRSVRLAQDPGDQVALEVNVTPVGMQARRAGTPVPPAPVYAPPVSYEQAAPSAVYAPAPVYVQPPVYAQPSLYIQPWPYVVIGGAWGWHGGWGGHRHH